jgi:hypothetical protein
MNFMKRDIMKRKRMVQSDAYSVLIFASLRKAKPAFAEAGKISGVG